MYTYTLTLKKVPNIIVRGVKIVDTRINYYGGKEGDYEGDIRSYLDYLIYN